MTLDDLIFTILQSGIWWVIYFVGYLISFAIGIARTRGPDFAEYVTLGMIALFWPVFAPFIIVGRVLHLALRRLKLI